MIALPHPAPTPVLAFAVRHTGAAAGIQITASHNPPADNGYKVYLDGGIQIVSPTDRDIETAIAAAPFADEIPRTARRARRHRCGRAVHRTGCAGTTVDGGPDPGGADAAARCRRRRGRRDAAARGLRRRAHRRGPIHPRPRLPDSRIPQPRGTGSHRRAARAGRRCRRRRGDRARPRRGPLRSRHPHAGLAGGCSPGTKPVGCSAITSCPHGDTTHSVVASTVVSSRMLSAIAAHWGARHVETLTGFKWLARADAGLPGRTLVYAYEEAIGHLRRPGRGPGQGRHQRRSAGVRSGRGAEGRPPIGAGCAGRPGPPLRDAFRCRRVAPGRRCRRCGRIVAAAPRVAALPIVGFASTTTDLLPRTDALIFTGGDTDTTARVVVRPSGTEPKVKFYIEVRSYDRDRATALRDELARAVRDGSHRADDDAERSDEKEWRRGQRGPNCRSPASPRPGTM